MTDQSLYNVTGGRVYIMTLGVLAAYREYGIGSRLLKAVTDFVETKANINQIMLHVTTYTQQQLTSGTHVMAWHGTYSW